jgi:WD40 repeat protein
LAAELSEVNGGRSNVLVVVDQAEELLTRSGVREQQAFLHQWGQPIIGHTNTVQDVEFSPDGTLLATASWDNTSRLVAVAESYSISQPLAGHKDAVNGVAFSPDGKLLATASADMTARLWGRGLWKVARRAGHRPQG